MYYARFGTFGRVLNNLEHIASRVTSFGTGFCERFIAHAFDSLTVDFCLFEHCVLRTPYFVLRNHADITHLTIINI